ncbi:hypothetical protein NDU88_004977 [Pleurodeles waltl]|uniref:Uncharacterized protein n=1 Tax=Pleurodeles waltl TaxID=8319 RepID=A0AAV7VK74_PLEWA|nr:hypothetical protein NDU88_004977 [Pleurodeles waltl]
MREWRPCTGWSGPKKRHRLGVGSAVFSGHGPHLRSPRGPGTRSCWASRLGAERPFSAFGIGGFGGSRRDRACGACPVVVPSAAGAPWNW